MAYYYYSFGVTIMVIIAYKIIYKMRKARGKFVICITKIGLNNKCIQDKNNNAISNHFNIYLTNATMLISNPLQTRFLVCCV